MSCIEHKPTRASRKSVTALSSYGIPQDDIAAVIGIDPKTLRKHYATELAIATTVATGKVAKTLFDQALAGNTAAIIFWLKVRGKWSEKIEHSHTFNGQKIEDLTDEELLAAAATVAPQTEAD